MLTEGAKAPSFALPGATAETQRRYRSTEFTDDGLTVLSFFPFDFSPVCSDQLCDLRDIEWFQIEDDVDVVGISGDSAHAHQAFIEHYELPFPLLSDYSGEVAAQFGVCADELEGHQDVAQRSFFVIDEDRTIRYTWLREDPYQQPPVHEIAEQIQSLR
jgi:peroxiredoxin